MATRRKPTAEEIALIDARADARQAMAERDVAVTHWNVAQSDLASARAHIAALKQVLADVLATIPNEYASAEQQLIRMRGRAMAEEV